MNPMTESKILRGIVVALIITFVVVTLAGCAISDEERIERHNELYQIESNFHTFVNECKFLEGSLYIPRGRVHNGIPTPWEMKDSTCYLDGRSIKMTEW